MNKIVIVGHPDSGLEDVEKMLQESGMCAPAPSLQEGLFPREIDSTICKAHGVESFGNVIHEKRLSFKSIKVSPVWNVLAMNLMRGNLELSLWGWADPMAVFLLDYWKTADPQILFMLVYKHPRSVLDGQLKRNDLSTGQLFYSSTELEYWRPYNEALLSFYHQNSERCLLVNSEQMCQLNNSSTVDIVELINAPSKSDFISQLNAASMLEVSEKRGVENPHSTDNELFFREIHSGSKDGGITCAKGKLSILATYLADNIVSHLGDEMELYEELQAVASIPLYADSSSKITPLEAWQGFGQLELERRDLSAQVQDVVTQMERLQTDIKNNGLGFEGDVAKSPALLRQMHQIQEAQEQTFLELQEEKKLRIGLQQNSTKAVAQETPEDVLFQQLCTANNELKTVVEQNAQLEKSQREIYIGAEARAKNELPYLVGTAIIERGLGVLGLLLLPWLLRLVVSRTRNEHLELAARLPRVAEYEDREEAHKVEKHLSHLLGTACLAHVDKPWSWVVMPWAFIAAYRRYRRLRKERKKMLS